MTGIRTARTSTRRTEVATRATSNEILEGLQPLRDLFALLLEADTPEAFEEAVVLVNKAAQRWAAVLTPNVEVGESPDATAPSVANALYQLLTVSRAIGKLLSGEPVTTVDYAPFWATNLGQLIFTNNGFPKRPATLNEAAAVLRMSRQGISQRLNTKDLETADLPHRSKLVKEDARKARAGQPIISRSSLYKEWRFRQKLRQWEAANPGKRWRGGRLKGVHYE